LLQEGPVLVVERKNALFLKKLQQVRDAFLAKSPVIASAQVSLCLTGLCEYLRLTKPEKSLQNSLEPPLLARLGPRLIFLQLTLCFRPIYMSV